MYNESEITSEQNKVYQYKVNQCCLKKKNEHLKIKI